MVFIAIPPNMPPGSCDKIPHRMYKSKVSIPGKMPSIAAIVREGDMNTYIFEDPESIQAMYLRLGSSDEERMLEKVVDMADNTYYNDRGRALHHAIQKAHMGSYQTRDTKRNFSIYQVYTKPHLTTGHNETMISVPPKPVIIG